MSLEVAARVELDRFTLDVSLQAGSAETVAVLGPNGAGKTTLLSAVAGLRAVDQGRIALGGRPLDDPALGVWVPAEDRSLGVVFQDRLLFPNLSALDNVAFGLRCRGVRPADARRRAAAELERVGLADQAGSRPAMLSGGQAQRVALARALVTEPAMLLLDEPLSALDLEARDRLRGELRAHLRAFAGPRLLITHEPLDALALADRVVVLEAGRVVQTGTPAELNRAPATSFVARLVGLNLASGSADGRSVRLGTGLILTTPEPHTGRVTVSFPPHAVLLHREPPSGSARNVWRSPVQGLHHEHDRVRVQLGSPLPAVAEVTPAAVEDLALRPGDEVWASVKATELDIHPA